MKINLALTEIEHWQDSSHELNSKFKNFISLLLDKFKDDQISLMDFQTSTSNNLTVSNVALIVNFKTLTFQCLKHYLNNSFCSLVLYLKKTSILI